MSKNQGRPGRRQRSGEKMALSYRLEEGILIISVSSNIDQFLIQQLDVRIDQIIEKMTPPKIIIDLSQAPYIGSSLVGKLAAYHRQVAVKAGKLVFCGLRPFIKNLFQVTRLDEVFIVARDVVEAKDLILG